jgi:hypothetical protein
VTVNIVGFQWQWQFTYQGERVPLPAGQPPEDLTIKGTIAKPPVMYLPVGEPIRFTTEAQDVIHSFYVREFLFKRDAFPGHLNTFDITITKPGDFGGQCTEYCGLAHQAMRFTVRAVSRPRVRRLAGKAKKEAASGCPADPNPRSIAAKDISFNKTAWPAREPPLPDQPSTTRSRSPTTSSSSRARTPTPRRSSRPARPRRSPAPRPPPTGCPRSRPAATSSTARSTPAPCKASSSSGHGKERSTDGDHGSKA